MVVGWRKWRLARIHLEKNIQLPVVANQNPSGDSRDITRWSLFSVLVTPNKNNTNISLGHTKIRSHENTSSRAHRCYNHSQLLETSRQVKPKLSNYSHNFNIRAVGVEIIGNTATTSSRDFFKYQLVPKTNLLLPKATFPKRSFSRHNVSDMLPLSSVSETHSTWQHNTFLSSNPRIARIHWLDQQRTPGMI